MRFMDLGWLCMVYGCEVLLGFAFWIKIKYAHISQWQNVFLLISSLLFSHSYDHLSNLSMRCFTTTAVVFMRFACIGADIFVILYGHWADSFNELHIFKFACFFSSLRLLSPNQCCMPFIIIINIIAFFISIRIDLNVIASISLAHPQPIGLNFI